jgi:hypothetical protein
MGRWRIQHEQSFALFIHMSKGISVAHVHSLDVRSPFLE